MKIKSFLIFLLLLIAAGTSYPQEKQLYGFGQLDFNSSRETVKDYMKNNYDMLPGYERDDAIGYQGGRYFKQNIFLWVFFFGDNGLQEVDLVVKNMNRPVGGIFSEVVYEMTADYGDPDLYKPDDWTAEWFYYDFPGKHLNATIKVSPYSNEKMTTIQITFLNS